MLIDPMVITSQSLCCLGEPCNSTGSTATSIAWQTASRAVFMPFTIQSSRTYKVVFWMNGATASGNVDAGVYNAAGVLQFSVGTTAQTGTTAIQQVAITATTLAAGQYYLTFVADNVLATLDMPTISSPIAQSLGIRHLSANFPLAASAASWVGTNQSRIPLVGISELSTI